MEDGTKVKAGDRITVTVNAFEVAGDGYGSWESGVKSIQVKLVPSPVGQYIAEWEHPSKEALGCDKKSWEKTFNATYTVPPNPPPIIKLCAKATDFEHNKSLVKCVQFRTGDVAIWKGTMRSDACWCYEGGSTSYHCTEVVETTLQLVVGADGRVNGEGHAKSIELGECYSIVNGRKLPSPQNATSAVLRLEGQKYDDRFEIQMLPAGAQSGQSVSVPFMANLVGPRQIIPIKSPGVAEGEVKHVNAANNWSNNTFRLKCESCAPEVGLRREIQGPMCFGQKHVPGLSQSLISNWFSKMMRQ